LLFRASRSAFGSLPARAGLVVMLFLPSLVVWSISLLKEPLYLLGAAMVLTGAIAVLRAVDWRGRSTQALVAVACLAFVRDRRPGALALAGSGLGCGVVVLLFVHVPVRVRLATAVAAVLLVVALASRPAAEQRITSALEGTAKTHAGHVFTVGHSY